MREDEWKDKQDIVKDIILHKLKNSLIRVYARKTEVKFINNKETSEFLNKNHLQGGVNSKFNLGLFFGNELVSIMSFGKPRISKNYAYEIYRFCNKLGYSVVGSFHKLLKFF